MATSAARNWFTSYDSALLNDAARNLSAILCPRSCRHPAVESNSAVVLLTKIRRTMWKTLVQNYIMRHRSVALLHFAALKSRCGHVKV